MADVQINNEKTVKEIVHLAQSVPAPATVTSGTHQFVIVPNDCKLEELSRFVFNEHNPRPERIKGTAQVHNQESFIEYFKLFRDDNSRVFADETKSTILAVFDYHEMVKDEATPAAPRWGQHRALLNFRHSKEWLEWKGKDGVKQAQVDFAGFIEDNAPNIINPSSAMMLDVARDLSAKIDVDFGSAVRLNNGQVKMKYSETINARFGNGELEVPEEFTIRIPIYFGCEASSITARLRYRLNSGKLTFWYNLLRADVLEREAFAAVRSIIGEELSVTVIDGVPA